MFAAYRARRLGALGVLTTIIVLAASPARGGCFASLTPSAGDPFIDCSFGIEHWEAGKRRDERYQQWHLTCRTPPRGQTSCELERVIYDMWSKDIGGVHVSFDKHSTEDGTLQLVDGRWEQGTLDFDVVMGTMTKDVCHVAMRIEVKELLVTLKSFKAVGVGRGGLFGLPDGNVVAVEYRIPDYSYTVNMQ